VLRLLFIGLCAFGASILQAFAQTPAPPVFDWTGYYIGFDAGTMSGDNTHTVVRTARPNLIATPVGVHAGFRIQYDNNFVMGWEAAASLLFRGEGSDFFAGSTTQGGQIKYNWDGSIRATFGWAFARSLIYGIGGVAFLDEDACGFAIIGGGRHRRDRFIPCIPGSEAGDVRFGWIAGIGLAHSFNERIAVRVEYLFADYGNQRYVTPASVTDFTDIKIRTQSVRIGLSYLFGGNSRRGLNRHF
jgi:outer membrane immunogenic protein